MHRKIDSSRADACASRHEGPTRALMLVVYRAAGPESVNIPASEEKLGPLWATEKGSTTSVDSHTAMCESYHSTIKYRP